MSFNSSILCEKSNTDHMNVLVNEDSNYGITSVERYILELEDETNSIISNYKINKYKAILENYNSDDITLNESIFSSIKGGLLAIINAIISFVKNIVSFILGSDRKGVLKCDIKDDGTTTSSGKTLPPEVQAHLNEKRELKYFIYPDIMFVDSKRFKNCMNELMDRLRRVCNNETINDDIDMVYKKAYETLSTTMEKSIRMSGTNAFDVSSVNDSESFSDFYTTHLTTVLSKTVSVRNYLKDVENKIKPLDSKYLRAYANSISYFTHDLEYARSMIKNANFDNEENHNIAEKISLCIKDIVESYSSFVTHVKNLHELALRMYNILAESVNNLCAVNKVTTESGFIHGEEFNSNTLFDNNDIRDFNRTEWLDLDIERECYNIKKDFITIGRRIAVNEALILSDEYPNKFNRLIAMREAQEKERGDRIKGIISNIRELLNKYIGNINERYNKNKGIIQKYTKFIQQPVTIKSVQSTGDILAGMYRIQKKIIVVPFNYETMKEDLKDKKIFFEKKILPNLKNTSNFTKRKVEWNSNMSITDYCKAYFGASMPENKYPKCEFSGEEIQANMSNIVKFLNISNTVFSAKIDLNVLENESKKASAVNPGGVSDQSAKTESYYSELYGILLTEADIEMDKTQNANNNENKSNGSEEYSNALKNYIECYKDVLLSKITASEFIVSELTQIVMAHAQSHMNSEQKKEIANNKK